MPTEQEDESVPVIETVKKLNRMSAEQAAMYGRMVYTSSTYGPCTPPVKRVAPGSMPKDKRPKFPSGKTLASVITKQVFDTSDEDVWNYYDGLGWVHDADADTLHTNYFPCAVRGTWHPGSKRCRTNQSSYICEAEAKANWFWDKFREKFYPNEEKKTVRDDLDKEMFVSEGTLQDQFRTCDLSKNWYPSSIVKPIHQAPGHDRTYNRVCAIHIKKNPNKFETCPNCNKVFQGHGIMAQDPTNPDSPMLICPICVAQQIKANIILPHDSKKYPKPLVSKKTHGYGMNYLHGKMKPAEDLRLYGVEAEIEIRSNAELMQVNRIAAAVELKQLLGLDFVVMKHDGSIGGTRAADEDGIKRGGDHGFEIVTAPADLATHRERWNKIVNAGCYPKLRSWDTETCGFHIHVSKASLTTLQIGRMLVMVHDPKNKKFIERVAGRTEVKYTKYVPKTYRDALWDGDGGHTDELRRVAINQQNTNTIEFRIFRGTINPRHIIRNIEFVDAVCAFCHPGSRSFKELGDFNFFIKFCNENRKHWPLFCEWLAHQDFITVRKPGKGVDRSKLTLAVERVEEGHMLVKGRPVKQSAKMQMISSLTNIVTEDNF